MPPRTLHVKADKRKAQAMEEVVVGAILATVVIEPKLRLGALL